MSKDWPPKDWTNPNCVDEYWLQETEGENE